MHYYICVTHASADRDRVERFCGALTRYGFAVKSMSEEVDRLGRDTLVGGATVLIALTSNAAAEVGSVKADMARARVQGTQVLCVSLEPNDLDAVYSTDEVALIPCPAGDLPDRHSAALFVHRLFVRHLSRRATCFAESRYVDEANGSGYGRVIRLAARAHAGDAAAAYALGCAYEQGDHLPAKDTEAAHWIARAADRVPDARIHLGILYLHGRGIEPNAAEAFRLFSKAAEAGDVRGEYHRGLCYLQAQGVLRDPERAIHCLEMAARAGYAPALYRLGLLFRDGVGTVPHHRKALSYLYAACKQGALPSCTQPVPPLFGFPSGRRPVCISMRQLRRVRLRALVARRLAETGHTPTERRLEALTARSFARCHITRVTLPEDAWQDGILASDASDISAEKQAPRRPACSPLDTFDVAEAALQVGRLLEQGCAREDICPHPTRALVWYRYALVAGSTRAVYHLGDAYRRGYGLPADIVRAVRLYRMAADHGDEQGQFALAVCCERGIGMPQDQLEAVRRYRQAAEAGYAPAQNNLGGCYEHGFGVAQDLITAVEWYAQAAAANQPDAACRLGLCYETGRGVSADPDQAFHFYEIAAAQGHGYALYRLGLCYEQDREGPRMEHALGGAPLAMSRYAYAAALWEQSAAAGVPDAAYALSLAYARGRGVPQDDARSLVYLHMAADRGHIQACYRLGMNYLEGRGTLQDTHRAVRSIARAIALWRERNAHAYRQVGASEHDRRPTDALSPMEAAGCALYMGGYCLLANIGGAHASTTLVSAQRREDPPAEQAAVLFREAEELDHIGAITALGDLYAYGWLTPHTATAEDESLRYYIHAAELGAARATDPDEPSGRPVHALISLYERSRQNAEQSLAEGDLGAAELARVRAWKSLASSAEQGSMDALVGMAACTYFGHGTPENHAAAVRLLERAERTEGGRVMASLWLGDMRRTGCGGPVDYVAADEAYMRALHTPYVTSECGPYIVGARRDARQEADRVARAEALYHLATLRAVHFADDPDRREAFAYLAEAVLMGHADARDDLARMYAYETGYIAATTPTGKTKIGKIKIKQRIRRRAARRRLEKHTHLSPTRRDGRAGRSHHGWMTDYYTALWPQPRPFGYGLDSAAVPTDRPAYVTEPVTDTMRAVALNYLGDCLFYGQGLPENAGAAVACYREVVAMNLSLARGESLPPGVVWAQYSLGWCLLHGVGTAPNTREAVVWLTRASRTHAEACYCLGLCHEQGTGVDVANDREAIRYYRKALKLGYLKAAIKVAELEKRLREGA